MKLPMLVVTSFSHSCQADVDDIKKFLTRYNPEDQEQSRRRQSTTPTTAPAAHNPVCPGLSKVGMGGPCTSNRHILEPPQAVIDVILGGITASKSTTPHKPRAAFTNAQVVVTTTTHGQNGASTSFDGHSYIPPDNPGIPMTTMRAREVTPLTGWSKVDVTEGSRKRGRAECKGDHDLRDDDDDSSTGHFSDPSIFDENESDSDTCNPTCPRLCQKHGTGHSPYLAILDTDSYIANPKRLNL